ncbi:MAG TPA: DUF1778 domain-containing protein [Thermomicrobiales bacterium]|nr:DUF1778 domain-containing protein [Thermomicrobiales bacterium]
MSEGGSMQKEAAAMRTDPCAPSRDETAWTAQRWSSRSEPLTAAPRLETTISVRFDPEAALLLRRAARLAGQTKSEFVRRPTIAAAEKKIADMPPPVSIRRISQGEGSTITRSGRSATNPPLEGANAHSIVVRTGSSRSTRALQPT